MKQNKIAAFLAGMLLLNVLTGCSAHEEKTSLPAESSGSSRTASQESSEKTDESSAAEEVSAKENEKLSSPEIDPGWCGDGSLFQLRIWAEETHPEAKAAVVYVGRQENYTGGAPFWESVETDGFLPFISEEISLSGWVELSNGGEQGDIWCVIPLTPNSSVTLSGPEGIRGKTREDQQTALFYWNSTDENDSMQVDITDPQGETAVFLLEPSLSDLPMDGSVLNLTVTDEKSPVAPWRFFGWWEAEDTYTDQNGMECTAKHQLWFSRNGHMTLICRVNGELVYSYDGIWYINENGRLVWQPAYNFTFELDFELDGNQLKLYAQEEPEQFCCQDGKTLLTFKNHAYFGDTRNSTRWMPLENLARAYYQARHSSEEAETVWIEAVGLTRTGYIMRCYQPLTQDYLTDEWFVLSPDGSGSDWLTGEELTLEGLYKEAKADYVRTELKNGNELTVTLSENPMVTAFLPEFEPGRAYPVEGLEGRITNVEIGFAGLDYAPFLLILQDAGDAYLCNLIKSGSQGSFRAEFAGVQEPVIDFDSGMAPQGEAGEAPVLYAFIVSGEPIPVAGWETTPQQP